MAVETRNELGKIILSEDLVASIAGYAAGENYGIVGMKAKNASDSIIELIKKDNLKRGIKVTTIGPGEVDIDLYVTVEYGVSLSAVAVNARDNIRYRVQEMTGLTVRNVNIFVEGIRV
ncbi:MAG TPA: Asp23/Gls24 family envelope stress response protein [Feifaniaceae bacterium]|nr:Asp23/Gls24 family envelope stress response protein [Feifaniaceae bacterium]